jgi:hypothetical protein
VDEWLATAEPGDRAVYWTGVSGPDPVIMSDPGPYRAMFNYISDKFHTGEVHLFQERIPRRGFDFVMQKRETNGKT